VLARAVLYGGGLLLLGGGAFAGRAWLEDARQDGLVTRLNGVKLYLQLDPDRAVTDLETEILAREPEATTRRWALLLLAAAHDAAHRYDASEAAYRRAEADWPPESPRGPLVVPWANMRVSAGRPAEALALLEVPGASDGWTEASMTVADVEARAREALAAPPAAPTTPSAGTSPAGPGR
jgi:hypothetical protein